MVNCVNGNPITCHVIKQVTEDFLPEFKGQQRFENRANNNRQYPKNSIERIKAKR
ncbi:hypothetical protein GCM10025767_14470 [Thalassotalea piscium]